MRDHGKLRAFVLADGLELLTSQMRRAAVSVPSNIVERSACKSQAEYIRFLSMAFSSLRELHYQLGLSKRPGLLDNQDTGSIEAKVAETEKVLNGLICSLHGA